MTTLTTAAARPVSPRVTVHPASFRRLVAAEWVKARSLRSTWWILLLGVAFFPAAAALRSSSIAAVPEAYGHLVGPVYASAGITLGQLALSAFAVVAATGEYRTGQIQATLVAAPTRLPALWAKLAVTVALVLAAGLAAVAAGWAGAAPWFDATGMTVDLTDPLHLRLLLGVPLYLAATAAFAFGVGAVVRSTAAGITVVLGLTLVVENVLALVPLDLTRRLAAYLPTSAGGRLVTDDATGSVVSASGSSALSPWAGFAVLVGWALASLVVASVLLRRRDA